MKVTLITGASGGIGKAFAQILAAQNHNLFLVARSAEKLKILCDDLNNRYNIKADYFPLDLTVFDADKQLFDETQKRKLEVAWLINNAGVGSAGYFSELDIASELKLLSLNINALVAITHRYLVPMRERRSGTIINVSSTASFQPIPFMASYAASKAFVTSFSEALAEEYKPFNIKIM
ncbi:MAG: SDR family NAD(P)-dependent oxidoreductase, partial [Leeuwenhoekiella sp.]